ncbi:hypothetical protein H8B15_09710 [Hymenobacter sp. BT507]|uniref:Tetratricopeptide repeat protein n=1 Tax=Hymenobacter citatus TaxID=2763506 RepID=A0ABR7MJD0_9BACT|nr:hypothetical protein [Hymenobacter citatus]MBC6611199.1 hypothetical protein [Hymenobacter citatus]
MKKVLFLLALATASLSASAQTKTTTATTQTAPAGYQGMMAAAIQELMQTGEPAALKASAATFERAATVAPQDWLPRYYQGYALLINVFQSQEEGDVKDKTLDQAEAALAQARKLGGDESELLALQAYIYQARLGVSPMLRSMKYSGMVNEAIAQAKKANPNNPRPYLIGANNAFFTPKMFGGGPEVAKPLYEEAKVKFEAFQPASAIAPDWGKGQLLSRLKNCNTALAAAK